VSNVFNDERPKVQLPGDNRLLSDFAQDLGKAIRRGNIFRRGGTVFSVDDRGDRLVQMTPDMLRSWLEQYAVCFRTYKHGPSSELIQVRRTMTQSDAAGVLHSPQFINELREIERFNPVRMPCRRFTGHIELLGPGYDEPAKTYTADNAPAVVNSMPFDMAKQIIDELLSEFGWADDTRSKAVAVAAMLTVYGSGILPSKSIRPCFIVLANAEGAGKTLLVKLATVPVLGYAPSAVLPKDEDEMRKILLSTVMEGRPVLFFDNFKGHLASESLEGFLTSQEWSGRILGGQTTFRGENNTVVFITGNGCTVSPDMRRRSLFVELFMEAERAEDRQFQNYLETSVLLERRDEIIAALWAFIRDWHNGTEPKPSRTHSSFREWAETIGGIVEYAGYGCPLDAPHIDAAADTNGDDMRELVKIVHAADLHTLDFPQLVARAKESGLFEWCVKDEMDARSKATFARILKTYDRRLVGHHRFRLVGKGRFRRFNTEEVSA